ncbi:MAG: DUF2652 domain-containing protein [Chloroflexi bacterium]|nr:DUF2652 domain-containing protein [Chloroflexota bacterium]MDA1148180.1 DUF2652 domain-containing protein [Chloroflexota bacterium]
MTTQNITAAQQGMLLLADISGYTAFLQEVGAAHSEEMARSGVIPEAYPLMATLLDGIVDRLVPPFTLSKTEGDAVFAFAGAEDFQLRGQQVLDCIDACYAAFSDRISALESATTCDCHACERGGGLDLKFILHAGSYVIQPIAGRQELLGPDVNAVHRLLKNHAGDVVGSRAYVLFTAAAVAALEVPLERSSLITETYEHLAPIDSYVFPVPVGAA